jgi:trans-aconitate methyltransferase
MLWDPERYNPFRIERTAPFEDLLQLVRARPGLKAIDLGCGTGELTSRLADFLPGGQDLVVFEKVYPHVLENSEAVADWSAGTALLPYMERLGEELRRPFMQRYRQKLHLYWPNCPVFYGFRRILFAATRA